MKRRSSKQPNDKKPVVANSELWREIPIGLQEKVRGGVVLGYFDENDGVSSRANASYF